MGFLVNRGDGTATTDKRKEASDSACQGKLKIDPWSSGLYSVVYHAPQGVTQDCRVGMRPRKRRVRDADALRSAIGSQPVPVSARTITGSRLLPSTNSSYVSLVSLS